MCVFIHRYECICYVLPKFISHRFLSILGRIFQEITSQQMQTDGQHSDCFVLKIHALFTKQIPRVIGVLH